MGRLRLLCVALGVLLGLTLYPVCTPTGMPILWALANPKIGEREVLAAMLAADRPVLAGRDRLVLIADEGFAGKAFETGLAEQTITLLRPSRKDETTRAGESRS
ncbi:hypothetical protein [Frankia sp. CiP3]|uniref:hypothetical protein n=1 Tax=Frankia sp. CiP3 TaxID=2880971 RepID=UPI001EF61BC0|nr:hypothetical protein [Frankia sp. CiP3]